MKPWIQGDLLKKGKKMRDMDHQSISSLYIWLIVAFGPWRACRAWMVPKPIISPTKRWAKEPGVMSRQHETGKLARHHVPNVYLNPESSGCLQRSPMNINELWFPESLGYTVTSKSSNSLQLMPSWCWRVGLPHGRPSRHMALTASHPSHGNSSGWHLVEARAARADVRIKLGCPKIFGWQQRWIH